MYQVWTLCPVNLKSIDSLHIKTKKKKKKFSYHFLSQKKKKKSSLIKFFSEYPKNISKATTVNYHEQIVG